MPRGPAAKYPIILAVATTLAIGGAAPLAAIDLSALVDAAVADDLEARRLSLALANAELDSRLRDVADGFALTLGGAGGSALGTSVDLANQTSSVSAGLSLSANLPSPLATALSVSVPLSYDSATETFDVDVSVSLSQSLDPLLSRAIVGAESSTDVAGALSLLRANGAVQRQRLVIRRNLAADLKTVVAQRRAGTAARQRAATIERDIETKRLLRQLEPGSFAEARLLADLAAERRATADADDLLDATVASILERTSESGATGESLVTLVVDDLPEQLNNSALSLPPASPPLHQPVLEAALELQRARLAAAEQRVDALPDISFTASYNITGETISASASVSLPLLRASLRMAAEQRANDIASAELSLTAVLQDYQSAYADLADRGQRQQIDMAVAIHEVEILNLQLDETLAAVAAGVSDASAADLARWQVEDATEALLLTFLDAELVAADIAELHLGAAISAGETAEGTMRALEGSTR